VVALDALLPIDDVPDAVVTLYIYSFACINIYRLARPWILVEDTLKPYGY